MKIYLNSYYPLQHTDYGKVAIQNFPELHPLEDGSIRREPDFNNPFPGVSGLCRPGAMNRINLTANDIIIYKTNHTHFLTAILKVIDRLNSHQEAKDWYDQKSLDVPSNCVLVDHLGVEKSHAKDYLNKVNRSHRINQTINNTWDEGYQKRAIANRSSYFFITKPIYNAVQSNLLPKNFIKLKSILRKYNSGIIPNTSITPQVISTSCYNAILKEIQ